MTSTESNTVQLFWVPCPDEATARVIAQALVNEQLAGCCNILPRGSSIYRWEGEVTEDGECWLLIKTLPRLADAVEKRVDTLHPYSCPCILRLAPASANAGWYSWLDGSL